MDGHSQRVMVNSSVFRLRLVTGSVPQGSVLGPVHFNIFFTDLVSGIEHICSKFAPLTKLNDAADRKGEWDAIRRDMDKLEKWAQKNLMRLKKKKKAKCKVLQSGQGNCRFVYKLGEHTEKQPCREGLRGPGG